MFKSFHSEALRLSITACLELAFLLTFRLHLTNNESTRWLHISISDWARLGHVAHLVTRYLSWYLDSTLEDWVSNGAFTVVQKCPVLSVKECQFLSVRMSNLICKIVSNLICKKKCPILSVKNSLISVKNCPILSVKECPITDFLLHSSPHLFPHV